jgi:hypothetical protein
MELQLPQQSYQSRSKPFSSERLLNMLFEKAAGSNAYMLIGTPGLKEYYDLGTGDDYKILGMIYLSDCLIVVTEVAIYVMYRNNAGEVSIITSKPWSELAGDAINRPKTTVKMVSNGQTVMLLNSERKKLYFVNLKDENKFAPSSWEFGPVALPEGSQDARYTSLAYISGVFVTCCQLGGNSYVQYTDVLAHEMRHAFQLDTALTNLTALESNMRELWCFGANSIEVVAPTGEADENFFAHVQGAYANKGCVCKNSIAVYETAFFFYGTNGEIYAADNYSNLRQISTPALLDMIKSWGTLETQEDKDGVIGQIYTQGGHTFYILKFKKFKKTLQYDLTTSSWVERETGDGGEWEGEYITRRPNGEVIVSSATTDKLYVMDSNAYTDNGVPICREFVFATLKVEEKKRMFFYNLTLDVDVGLGPDDTVMLTWSDDGGYTWVGERSLRLGNFGQYHKKLQFRRLGSSTLRTYKVRFSTASMVNVLSASISMEQGLI